MRTRNLHNLVSRMKIIGTGEDTTMVVSLESAPESSFFYWAYFFLWRTGEYLPGISGGSF